MYVSGLTHRHEGEQPSTWQDSSHSEALRSLTQILLTSNPGATRIRRWTRDIGRLFLRTSPHVREPNFTRLHVEDLSFLFDAYDRRFLNGLCRELLGQNGMIFRLSIRMTRAGAKTTRFRHADGTRRFEIAVAISMLFDGFAPDDPAVTVCGLPCRNRLEALQRVFEHEIVHLVEGLCWDASHCTRPRFQGIATRLFQHQAHTHQLITPSMRAADLGFTIGARVKFNYQGRWISGRINRITKRATVLVDNPTGELMSDGRRYIRRYVPLSELRPAFANANRDSGSRR